MIVIAERIMNKYKHSYNVILDNMDINEYRLRPISAIMYLQDAFARYCATKKVAAYDLFPHNLYWVVGEFNIDFRGTLPFWSEEITTEIWISEITKLKIYTDFKLYYNNSVFAQGNGCWFILDQLTKRPVKTDIIRDKFEICDEFVLGEHKKFLLPEQKEKVSEIIHTNNLSDLDFNNHVNNKSYINLAEMTAGEEFRKTHSLKSLNIRFNRETFLGDSLVCGTYKTFEQNKYIHTITKEGVSVCDISTVWESGTDDTDILSYELKVKSEK